MRGSPRQAVVAAVRAAGWWCALLMVLAAQVQAQAQQPPPAQAAPAMPEQRSVISTLRTLQETYDGVKKSLEEQRKRVAAEATEAGRAAAQAEAERLEQRRQELERDFVSVATGVSADDLDGVAVEEDVSLNEELARLVKPILGELREMSRVPRAIQDLKRQREAQVKRIDIGRRALAGLVAVLEDLKKSKRKEDATLMTALDEVRKGTEQRLDEAAAKETVLSHQIAELESAEGHDLWSVLAGEAKRFVFGRGKNILLALLAFGLVFFGIRTAYLLLLKYLPQPHGEHQGVGQKLVGLLNQGLSLVLGVLAALAVLYASGDWVLGGIAVMALIGLVLLAKNGMTHYFEQVRMLLNLGSVREGERVVVDGVPWRVGTINFYTLLTNPAIGGTGLRVPLDSLMKMTSRPCLKDEAWFPSQEKDWVMVDDEVLAQVVSIRPDLVELCCKGGQRRLVPTSAFVEMQPMNLSRGFGLSTTFGIDYKHQAESTKTIPKLLADDVREGLLKMVKQEDLLEVTVEFQNAGASSLDYAIIARFSGQVADRQPGLKRALQRLAVDACNKRGWVIPFQQLVVHRGEG